MKSCALDAKCSDVDFKKYMTEIDDLINKNEKTNADFLNECQKFGKEHCDNIIIKEYFDKYQKQIAQAIKNGDTDSDELKKWLMQNYNVMSLGYNSTPSFLHKFILAMGESSQTADNIFLAGITGGESIVWRKIFSKTGGNSSATSVISKEGLSKQLKAQKISNGHAFQKHVVDGKEFSEFNITTKQQFQELIENVITNPSEIRYASDGRVFYLQKSSRIVVVYNPSHEGSAFRPSTMEEWEKYIAQIPARNIPYE